MANDSGGRGRGPLGSEVILERFNLFLRGGILVVLDGAVHVVCGGS